MDVRRLAVCVDYLGIDSMVHFYIERVIEQRVNEKKLN